MLDFSNNRVLGVLIALAVTFTFFSIMVPSFLTVNNLLEMGVQSSIIAVIALGMTLVIVTGGIDLSVGSIVGLVSVVCATNLAAWGTLPTILVGLALGAVLGFINGAFSALFALESFVVTLATLNVYRGLAFLYTGGRPVFGLDQGFRDLLSGRLGPIPNPIILVAAVTLICYLILNRSRLGVHLKAVGTNSDAARKSGVAVNRTKVMAFVLAGTLSGLAALLLMSRIGAAEPISGTGYELLVIAAVVVGGTSLMGGRASIVGTVLGALLLGSIRTGLTLLNVNPFLQLVVTGVIILLAVLVDRAASRSKAKR
ncbi:ribose transport system permease protein [Marisediminicola sp. UYEF4]|uniref:ABC transporter permease n=1 Tax=Marisediminicola sp. UYEF4 TaxID=1756384 RepID=UPI003394B253